MQSSRVFQRVRETAMRPSSSTIRRADENPGSVSSSGRTSCAYMRANSRTWSSWTVSPMTIRAYMRLTLLRSLGHNRILQLFVLFLGQQLSRDQVALAAIRPSVHNPWLIDGFDRRSRHLLHLSAERDCPDECEYNDSSEIST